MYAFKPALFMVAKNWKQWQGPSKGDWLNKSKHSHPVECYIAGGRRYTWMCNNVKNSPGYTIK